MKPLLKFFQLSLKDKWLLLETGVLLNLTRLALELLPFQTTQRILAKLRGQASSIRQIDSVDKVIWAVEVISRYSPGTTTCLPRALVTQLLLARRGYTPVLRIGVAHSETGKLEAHAWVENQGNIVIGKLGDLARFIPLPSLEPEGS